MRDTLIKDNNFPDKTEVHALKPIKKELRFQGRIKPHKGHTLYKINLETKEITEAEFKKVDISFYNALNGNYPKSKTVITEPGFRYISALNKENTLKRLSK